MDIDMGFRFLMTVINACLSLVIAFLPVISISLLKLEGEALELNIHERLLQERDGELQYQLQMFAEYVEGRPTRFQLLRVFELDWTLPLKIIHLCVTYQIIIVQLTHLF
ncbi:unnamed protein product [Chilo suppressalis]|uniref:Uncharacterized protein n=1 Tax=Chilo suppressalis TaxID=168631 RepID=A0ABN8B097_CHISP|nr:hypothetical protein evm_008298 [Chilo suppressalis]CAH0402254.1 unnamed protein product [Chilo suppressalis]